MTTFGSLVKKHREKYRLITLISGFFPILLTPLAVQAHFGMLIPSSSQVSQKQPEIDVLFAFAHPFENSGMDLEWPLNVFVSGNNEKQDLKGIMLETSFLDHRAWKITYKPPKPGLYWVVMEPEPYWEPAEDIYIVHYTKTAISAYGGDQGWGLPVGLKTEIVPLVRPFGNYAGNIFSGQVLVDNTPMAGVDVEVELYNQDKWVAPTEAHITQVVKTDTNGNFSFACPLPGWWGFSALSDAEYSLKGKDGTDKNVELGAVIWVYFDPNPFLGS
jgi:cobalt/nickel transport protein